MALFGTTPPGDAPSLESSFARSRHGLFNDEPAAAQSNSDRLFNDEPAAAQSNSDRLFNDDDVGGRSASPWDIPAPRKPQSRAELLRNLLPSTDVPDLYIQAFDAVVRDGGDGQNKISASGVARTLAAAELNADRQAAIMSIVAPPGSATIAMGRNEFNVLLALIGLAQEGETTSLDGVDERRRNLPHPRLPGLIAAASPAAPPASTVPAADLDPEFHTPPSTTRKASLLQSSLTPKRVSMDYPPEDPWGSPDLRKISRHGDISQSTAPSLPKANGAGDDASATHADDLFASGATDNAAPRTTSNFTTSSSTTTTTGSRINGSQQSASASLGAQNAGLEWGTAAADADVFRPSVAGAGLDDGRGHEAAPDAHQSSRTIGSGRTGNAIEENILVTLLPEKEGIFMFQHHNYEVINSRRGSKVIRRYSDFVWLLECLHKRYPFRVLPLLPPKRVAVNGNHLSNDGAFIEKRRRGLARFLNALVRHPVLSTEQLVVMFLTVPTELSVWRKQATISVQDEFAGRPLPPGLEESLSPQLKDLFDQTRSGVRRSADIYITACNIMDRLVKRSEGVANDHARLAVSLHSLTEVSASTYATDVNDVPLLNDGLTATSKHLRTSQTLMEDEARAWDAGILEDLKRQRDALVGLRDLFDRRDRLDRDNIPLLERRIQNNETKLATLRAKPEELVKPGDIEKVVEAIIKDKESIVSQHNRSVFVKECIRDELIYFQSTQYHVSRWNQDWAQERVKYSEMLADNWRRLLDELDGMPLGD